jgi:hypothetical protein
MTRSPPRLACRRAFLACLTALCAPTAAGGLALDPAIARSRKWGDGARQYAQQAFELAATKGPLCPDDLADALNRHALCELLANAESRGWNRGGRDQSLLRWLLTHPPLAHTLAAAVRPQDDPARVLAALGALLPAAKRWNPRAPDLLVAFAVVWDSRFPAPGARPKAPLGRVDQAVAEAKPAAQAQQLFAHYAANARRTCLDLERLPWQFATFLADAEASEAGRTWALDRYAGRANYRQLYDAVPYQPHRRAWTRQTPYTLANILRLGGTSADQAYFAAQVAKACGCPCFAATTPSRTGVAQATVVELTATRSGGFGWDAYGASGKLAGSYADPQTGEARSLSDARLLARTLSLPPDRRRAGDACLRAAELLRGRLSPARRLALLEQAVRFAPYDPRPWLALSAMMGRGRAAAQKAGSLYRFLLEKFRRYPEFTHDILHALMPLIPADAVERRRRLYEATFQVYRHSPRVVAKLMMELAAYLEGRKLAPAALATYRSIVERYRDQGHLAAPALAAAEELCRRHKRLPQAIELYEQAYDAYRDQEEQAVEHGRDAFVYRFADKLARLHHEVGNGERAAHYDRICRRIDQRIAEHQRRDRR